MDRVISCTSVNSFHNEHLTYIIALFENGFMNKTDIKVKKSGKCMFLCGENGKVNEDARKSSIKMERIPIK